MLRSLAACLVLSALAFAACGGGNSQTVVGVITSVDAPTLTQLNSFTLHTDDGRTLVFHIAPEATRQQHGFVGGHLRAHLLAANKVEITYRTEGDELLALELRDL